jgi:hypothetical protein
VLPTEELRFVYAERCIVSVIGGKEMPDLVRIKKGEATP